MDAATKARVARVINDIRRDTTRRLESDPAYSVYTAQIIIREVEAALRNAAQAVLLMGFEDGPPPGE